MKNGEISILVRDDGSTDGIFEILEKFKEKKKYFLLLGIKEKI